MNEEQNLQEQVNPALNIASVNGSISAEIATKRLRQAIEYAKYKDWNSEVGNAKAKSICDDFHSGVWGSKNGMYVQINEAIKFMEDLYCR